jgi:hypothetical protein
MSGFHPEILFVDANDVLQDQNKKKIRGHIVREALRRKRHRGANGLSILPPTSASTLPRESSRINLGPEVLTLFEDSPEMLFRRISDVNALDIYNIKDETFTIQSKAPLSSFKADITYAAYYYSLKKNELAGPLAERALQNLKALMLSTDKDISLQLVYAQYVISAYGLKELAGVLSSYVWQLSTVLFGSGHPISRLARSIQLNSTSANVFYQSLMLIYDGAVKASGKQTILSVLRLSHVMLALTLQNTETVEAQMVQRLQEAAEEVLNMPVEVQLYVTRTASTLLKNRGRFRDAARSLLPSYHALQRSGFEPDEMKWLVRNSVKMCEWTLMALDQEEVASTSASSSIVVERLEVAATLERILDVSFKNLGPEHEETLFTMDFLQRICKRFNFEHKSAFTQATIMDRLNKYKLE